MFYGNYTREIDNILYQYYTYAAMASNDEPTFQSVLVSNEVLIRKCL